MGTAHAPAQRRARPRGWLRNAAPPDRDAVCEPRLSIAPDAATVGALLRHADAGTRERLAGALQRRHGNAALQRLVAPGTALPVQRWRVALARSTTDCDRILAYVDAHTPYAATGGGWAETKARFRWHGEPAYEEGDAGLTARVAEPRVTKTVTVDMPQWAPTDPAIRAAWAAATSQLRAHEAEHEQIAADWQETLRGRLASFSAGVADRRSRTWTAAVQAEWDGWIAEYQDAQAAIDPYEAVFECPTPVAAAETEAEPGPG